MYKDPKNVFQKKLKESIKLPHEESILEDLIRLHLIKNAEKDEDLLALVEIYNYFGTETFTDFIDLCGGKTFKVPTKEEFKDTIITVLSYYYKNVENKSWEDIKSLVGDPDLNTVKFGIRANSLGAFLSYITNKVKTQNGK